MALGLGLGAVGARLDAAPELPTDPGPPAGAPPDYTLHLGQAVEGRLALEAAQGGSATLEILGLQRGGAVTILVNGSLPPAVELRAGEARPPRVPPDREPTRDPAPGLPDPLRADRALVRAVLNPGRNTVAVSESDGVQVVHQADTGRWFAVSTHRPGQALLILDLEALAGCAPGFPAQVPFGPGSAPFVEFSGRWREHQAEACADRLVALRISSGTTAAVLFYELECPRSRLVMPTWLTVTADPATGAVTVRSHQTLRAIAETACGDRLGFLWTQVGSDPGEDWGDGTLDYAWYRYGAEDCPDAPPGGHTGMVRLADSAMRYALHGSDQDLPAGAPRLSPSVTAAVPLSPTNTIGGFFGKTGVGSCGWVLHQYGATSGRGLSPLYSRCGPEPGTRLQVSWPGVCGPLVLGPGEAVVADISLTMLPAEVTREEIEDLNEADLLFFGTDKEQTAPVTRWTGTADAVGLLHGDGSLILLGLGRQPARVPIPSETGRQARTAYRLFDLVQPTFDFLELGGGTVEVWPGWITLVDCGAALWEPCAWVSLGGGDIPPPPPAGSSPQAGVTPEPDPWPRPPTGGPFQGSLRLK